MGVIGTAVVEVRDALPILEDSLRGKLDIDGEAVTAGTLPPSSSEPSRAHLIEAPGRYGSLVGNKQNDKRCVVVGLKGLNNLLGHDGAGHLGTGVRSNGVDEDVVLLALESKRLGETEDTALGRGVVGLTEVSVNTAGRGGVEDASILLLQHVWPSSLCDGVRSEQVNLVDDIPLVVCHVGKGLVAEDTGVVDDNVDATPCVNSSLDDSLAVLNISLVANSLTTEFLNFLNNIVRVDQIVDNDLCASLSQLESVDATETSTTTSDKSDLSAEVELLTLGVGRKLASLLEELESVGRALWVLWLREVNDILPLSSNGARCKGLVGLEVNTIGTLPSQLSNVTSACLEYRTGLGVRLVCKDSDKRDNPLRLQLREDVGGHDSLSHSAGCDRRDDVAEDVVLQTLLCERLGETNKGKLRSWKGSQHMFSCFLGNTYRSSSSGRKSQTDQQPMQC